ncbi:MAG: amidohydrolase [Alphaproteobacteria bacterium]
MSGCDLFVSDGKRDSSAEPDEIVRIDPDPFPSTYEPMPSKPVLITGATVLTGTGERLENGHVLMKDGKIVSVGAGADAPELPEGGVTVDGQGKWVTPGVIDIHSHLGVYPSPSMPATADGNEATAPVTAEVWAEHSVWTQDPGFTRALAGGVTSLMILPGSANLFGGRSVTLKNVPARTVQGMKFPGAPYGLKMACGENPKRVYGGRKQAPSTRMGNMAGYRAAWADAQAYQRKWDAYYEAVENGEDAEPPARDLELDTLSAVLRGEIIVHMHCYRAEEMAAILDMAQEFGYRVSAFHHAVESYKVADILAENDVCSAMWADWWGFKLEAYDMVRENAPMVHAAGACAIVHSDSDVGIQRLNQEAAKTWADGRKAGFDIPRAEAIAWITANPARAMGIYEKTGSLESGKAADVVLWDGDPFSVYTQAEHVYIDGALAYDRDDPKRSPRTDFEVGQHENARTGGAGQ